jgi:hypothetical protein
MKFSSCRAGSPTFRFVSRKTCFFVLETTKVVYLCFYKKINEIKHIKRLKEASFKLRVFQRGLIQLRRFSRKPHSNLGFSKNASFNFNVFQGGVIQRRGFSRRPHSNLDFFNQRGFIQLRGFQGGLIQI